MSNIPCPTCPWRRSSTVGGFDIPHFDLDLMRALRTCFGEGDEDGFYQVMACHYSPPKELAACGAAQMKPCIGYIIQYGYHNINVRLLAADGRVDLPAIWQAQEEADCDLWPDFETMLAAYEEANHGG